MPLPPDDFSDCEWSIRALIEEDKEKARPDLRLFDCDTAPLRQYASILHQNLMLLHAAFVE
jgi:hypothetical protein